MNGDDEDRREGARRSSDQALQEWRGRISEQVRAHERKFVEHNGDLRALRGDVQGLREDVIGLNGQVAEARSDIGDAVASITQSRATEISDLRSAIKASKVTGRDLLQWIGAPIFALVIGTLLIALIVGHGHIG